MSVTYTDKKALGGRSGKQGNHRVFDYGVNLTHKYSEIARSNILNSIGYRQELETRLNTVLLCKSDFNLNYVMQNPINSITTKIAENAFNFYIISKEKIFLQSSFDHWIII